jgi:DNA repair protein RadC
MQENMKVMEKVHPQGQPPLEAEQTAPILQQKKRSYVMKEKYAYSIKTSRVKEPDFPYEGQQINGTEELLRFARSLQDSDIEKMLTLYLDAQNQLLCIQIMKGTCNQATVYPREVIRHALLVGASSIILVHNHPSGRVRPSDFDIDLTKEIQKISKFLELGLHDHVIIGSEGRFFSFREKGLLP